jgi:hypothetical protein
LRRAALKLRSVKIMKPFGFSWFPRELTPQPRSWIENLGDLVYFKHHENVGFYVPGDGGGVCLEGAG